jgi:2-C-methyl-D-erythritol 2,4-cyclodiphosphate synthase
VIIGQEELPKIRRENAGKRIVLLKGTFDLLHPGHVNRMRAAKDLGDILVVFVKCDEVLRWKGAGRPVEDEEQRAAVVDAVRYVDYTVIANRKVDVGVEEVPQHEREQYLRYYKMISDLKPDVLVKPEKELPRVLSELYRKIGTSIHVLEETPGISTTMLIDKIRKFDEHAGGTHLPTSIETGARMIKTAIGQDSHRFDTSGTGKPLVLAGVEFDGEDPLEANSDGDVVLHAVTRAVSGITTVDVLGPKTKEFLGAGITDSRVYLKEALKDLRGTIVHVSVSIECSRPRITPKIPEMRNSLSSLLNTDGHNIGITATSGEGLTEAGKGNAISVLAVLTVDCD